MVKSSKAKKPVTKPASDMVHDVFKYDPSKGGLNSLFEVDNVSFADVEWCCGAEIFGGFPLDTDLNRVVRDLKEDWEAAVKNWMDFDDVDWYELDLGYQKTHLRLRPKKPLDAWFKTKALELLKEQMDWPTSFESGKIYFSILIDSQLWLKPRLIESGFRLVSDRTCNRNGGNRLYVFIRDPLTPKGKKLQKRFFR